MNNSPAWAKDGYVWADDEAREFWDQYPNHGKFQCHCPICEAQADKLFWAAVVFAFLFAPAAVVLFTWYSAYKSPVSTAVVWACIIAAVIYLVH